MIGHPCIGGGYRSDRPYIKCFFFILILIEFFNFSSMDILNNSCFFPFFSNWEWFSHYLVILKNILLFMVKFSNLKPVKISAHNLLSKTWTKFEYLEWILSHSSSVHKNITSDQAKVEYIVWKQTKHRKEWCSTQFD